MSLKFKFLIIILSLITIFGILLIVISDINNSDFTNNSQKDSQLSFEDVSQDLMGMNKTDYVREEFLDSKDLIDASIVIEDDNKLLLNDVIKNFIQSKDGNLALLISNVETNEVLVEINSGKSYFTASLYKLYLAFLIYEDIDNGIFKKERLNEKFINHRDLGEKTFKECLDLMVRISDSICAEKFLDYYNRDVATQRLKSYGLINTNVEGFYTTASDMHILLNLIYSHDYLAKDSRQLLLDSMQTDHLPKYEILSHIFKDEIKQKDIILHNKIGTSEEGIWHDIGIIVADNNVYSIVILSDDIGVSLRSLVTSIKEVMFE